MYQASPRASTKSDLMDGYQIAPATTFEIVVSPDGETKTFTGTAEQVIDELDRLYPEWETYNKKNANTPTEDSVAEFKVERTTRSGTGTGADTGADDDQLEARSEWDAKWFCCIWGDMWDKNDCGGGQPAYAEYIQQGAKYLARLGGKPLMPANSCHRVSCSYNSAIYLCNDVSALPYDKEKSRKRGQGGGGMNLLTSHSIENQLC